MSQNSSNSNDTIPRGALRLCHNRDEPLSTESINDLFDLPAQAPRAPRGGNTGTPRGAPAKHWIGTVPMEVGTECSNGSVVPDFLTTFRQKITALGVKYIFQHERGVNGYEHLQIYLELPRKQRLSWLKNKVHPTAHWEVCLDIEESKAYCCKPDTRVAGPWSNVPIPRDIAALLAAELDHPLREWQQKLHDELLAGPADSRIVTVYVDEVGNTGKSWFVKHMVWKYPDLGIVYCTTTRSADILTAINADTRIVLIDIPRCVSNNDIFPANAIEQIKNGMISQGKLQKEMQFVLIPSVHVVVFTNHYPDLSKLSGDRWQIRPLLSLPTSTSTTGS